jgi:parallel beta-helix repeat protein
MRFEGKRGVAYVVVTALTALAVLLPGSGTSARAATLMFVDGSNPSCSDTGTGSSTQPFCKISVAAQKATAGTTVQVAAGTYSEQVSIANSGTSDAPIVFTAAPGASVIVNGVGNGFSMSNKSFVTINGFFLNGTANYGINIFGGTNVTISNNRVTSAGTPVSGSSKSGIRLTGTTDSLVENNISDHNSDHGILITTGAARNRITGNVVFNNAREFTRAATGIRIYQSPDCVVDHNVMHDNEDSGVESYAGSNNTLFYDNVSYNNGDHGIDNNGVTGEQIISNTVYKNLTAGINVEGTSPNATIENNISVDNGIASPRQHSNIRVEASSISGTTMDYDLVNLSTPDTMLIWNSIAYTSLASFQAATGQEAHGLQADPLWANPAGADFHLTAGSPAIDSADSGVAGQPTIDADGNPRVDDPSTPDTGAGVRTFDDRGAYEFQPPAIDAPPVAALTVTVPSPLNVSADASASTDGDATPIASYTFDFGDGSVLAPQAAPTADHTYANGGIYTVTVTVTDTAGLSSTATQTVDAGPADAPPVASVSVTPGTGYAPLPVTADASASTDTDSTPIATYAFNFGDGSTVVGPQAGATASHTYAAAGTYTVTVTVADTAGYASTAKTTVTVTPDQPPVAALTLSPTSPVANVPVTADASGSMDLDLTPIATYTFDFGDGSAPVGPQVGATASHTYTHTGTFTVQVTVTDTAGLFSTATATAVVGADRAPVAALKLSPSPTVLNLPVTANASGSTDTDAAPIASYTFRFGDGSVAVGPQAGATAPHTYTRTGTFTVQVTVTDTLGLSSTATSRLVVATDQPPVASMTVSPNSGVVNLAVTAKASNSTDTDATPIATYTFRFGDGSAPVGPQAGSTASHTYTQTGTFTVQLTVTDTAGLSSTASKTVVVTDAPPVANLDITPSQPGVGQVVTANAAGSTDTDATPIASYTFNFGDGTALVGPQASPTATHVYSRAAFFTVTLTVRDTAGNASTTSKRVKVR